MDIIGMKDILCEQNGEPITEKQMLDLIGMAIKEENYQIACDLLSILNQERITKGFKPYTTSDVLFINFASLMPETKKDDNKSIYVVEFDDGTIKVGVSANPNQRINALTHQKGFKAKRGCFSEFVDNAYSIENAIHKKLSNYRLEGEYFNCDYQKAVEFLQEKIDIKGSFIHFKR